ncbi:MAG TPA: rhodanese-like domain-containing protein [Pseudoduganella sp.]
MMAEQQEAQGFRRDLARWRHLLHPAWLDRLLRGRPVLAAPSATWLLFEVGCGGEEAFAGAHIPGASYLDTNRLEIQPLWNKVADCALLSLLLEHGIRHDTTVILYGRSTLAAARAAHLMLYAGVADVRLLDGGFDGWQRAGYPLETGQGG